MFNFIVAFIPLAPLLASVVIALLGPRWLKEKSHVPCVGALAVSCICSLLVLLFGGVGSQKQIMTGYEWIRAGDLVVNVTLRVDALTAVMLATVTFVSLLVAIYSIGYLHHDKGYARFFASIALFVFSMTMLVLANSFLLLYVFWEAVGLCSYLLIGFWFEKPSAAAAAKKAFLVNRIGDFGFSLGIFLLWILVGEANHWQPLASGAPYLDYDTVFSAAAGMGHANLVLICLLLFMGAVGKSAQFPLHVWLPDAMEGPTPVSALIHAATMVTAGVYMVARCSPLFVFAPEAQLVVAGIGGFTALLAALIALTQYDLKRVLAYSTVSQLGYMFMALGAAASGRHLLEAAVLAAMFHLFTHAFFKALLFLGSGSVMHSMGNVIDMRRFGGLRHVMPTTRWTFLCGAAALAGLPLLAGFWSKDEIVTVIWAGAHGTVYRGFFEILFDVALFTAFLTAFYTFRAYFLTFGGAQRFPPEAGEHPHESPEVMLWPLRILAGFALFAGILFVRPFTHYLPGFFPHELLPEPAEPHPFSWGVVLVSSLIAIAGVWLAWLFYAERQELPERAKNVFPVGYILSQQKFYFDEIYDRLVVRPVRVIALFCQVFDKFVIDNLVDLVGWIPVRFGQIFRPVQNGLVQSYALIMMLGLTLFAVVLMRAFAG